MTLTAAVRIFPQRRHVDAIITVIRWSDIFYGHTTLVHRLTNVNSLVVFVVLYLLRRLLLILSEIMGRLLGASLFNDFEGFSLSVINRASHLFSSSIVALSRRKILAQVVCLIVRFIRNVGSILWRKKRHCDERIVLNTWFLLHMTIKPVFSYLFHRDFPRTHRVHQRNRQSCPWRLWNLPMCIMENSFYGSIIEIWDRKVINAFPVSIDDLVSHPKCKWCVPWRQCDEIIMIYTLCISSVTFLLHFCLL